MLNRTFSRVVVIFVLKLYSKLNSMHTKHLRHLYYVFNEDIVSQIRNKSRLLPLDASLKYNKMRYY